MPELDLSSFPEALALFDGPISMVLGSSNVQKRPHFARAQGVRRGEAVDEIVVLVPDIMAAPIVHDVQVCRCVHGNSTGRRGRFSALRYHAGTL